MRTMTTMPTWDEETRFRPARKRLSVKERRRMRNTKKEKQKKHAKPKADADLLGTDTILTCEDDTRRAAKNNNAEDQT